MKKLMVAMTVVALSIFAHAATVNWSVTNIQSSPDNAVAAGWIVQIFDNSVAFDYAKASAGELTAWVQGATVAAGTSFRANGSTSLENGTSKDVYAVIYDASAIADAKNYIVSDVLSITAAANGATVAAAFGSMTSSTGKFAGASWTTTAVPEPTSGLLMLLGMAGLALRRRRA